MSHKNYGYTVEKLTNTLECLVTHPGDARHRLKSAYLSFHTLKSEDFPQEYGKDWIWIMNELTKYGPIEDIKGKILRGSLENTLSHMRNSTASKIAKKIYELYWVVSENQQYR